MLTTEEQRALLALCALVLAGALLGWLDAKEPRWLALTLGDSLALGATVAPDSTPPDLPASAPAESTAFGGRTGLAAAPPGGGASLDPASASTPQKSAYGLDGKLNLNAAAADALEELPGIGPKTAQRILADRRAHGPYRRISDLRRVKGIGPKTLARLLPHVSVGAARDSTR
jgi:competence protein ComEA